MVRVRRLLVVGLVAADAVARRALVDGVLVARGAGLRRVDADQREDARVVERRPAPRGVGRAVARFARGREAGGGVVGVRRPLVVRSVAADAVARRAGEDVGAVARRARLLRVRADEREAAPVVEGRLVPGGLRGRVAHLAVGREAGRGVVGLWQRASSPPGGSRRSCCSWTRTGRPCGSCRSAAPGARGSAGTRCSQRGSTAPAPSPSDGGTARTACPAGSGTGRPAAESSGSRSRRSAFPS